MAFEGFLTSVYAGDDVSRPTFFELVAQEQIVDALRPAVRFVVGVLADSVRSPIPLRILGHWDTLYNIGIIVFEWRCLRANGAGLGEHFYGLKREERPPIGTQTPLEAVERLRRRQKASQLTVRQCIASLLLSVLLPEVLRLCEIRFREATDKPVSARSLEERCWVVLYPWVHAANSGISVAYKLLYLLGRTEVWSPLLHVAGLRLVRHFPEQPAMNPSQPTGWLQRLATTASTAAGASLWTAIYGMQFGQWWFAREHLLQPHQSRKVPPPPPPRLPYHVAALKPFPSASGALLAESDGALSVTKRTATDDRDGGAPLVLLPEDRTVCALCHRIRRNPAMSSGGYVFCYPCLVPHVEKYQRCPVTGLSMTPALVRRVIDD
eukprot:TRINITY_DN74671_c0_g1_i1.p1 TRINITY_DN74671_c0_g1~~TRINITY_DN74671_c0_g1_i1.p1  ORF type:complete len:380 (+),score=44.61 TRINITY_DN74671_c0_g1_i1:84-1223(+)